MSQSQYVAVAAKALKTYRECGFYAAHRYAKKNGLSLEQSVVLFGYRVR